MTWPVEGVAVDEHLAFANPRVHKKDAVRQTQTVIELLRRLGNRPGAVLADEVGMGKTFVALGVATLAALADHRRRPVVVMVPSALQSKWPNDFEVFRSLVLKKGQERILNARSAGSALEFFRLIAEPVETRPRIIFLKHGAFHSSQIDPWVRLALIKRAMTGMHLGERRTALPRFAPDLLRTRASYRDEDLFDRLLRKPMDEWKDVINTHYAERPDLQVGRDPVPKNVRDVLERADLPLDDLKECLRTLPARSSDNIEGRLANMRSVLNIAIRELWQIAIGEARFRSPLLILDEAHHLKNPETRLASLFVEPDAEEDVKTLAGTLQDSFERMLFLTATPFQLGHHELLNVISRFRGIAWNSLPSYSRDQFDVDHKALSRLLDQAQHAAIDLDAKWKSVRSSDPCDVDGASLDIEKWWRTIREPDSKPSERLQVVLRSYDRCKQGMKEAEAALRPWIVRHLRDRELPGATIERRRRLVGRSLDPQDGASDGGLPVDGESLLPFLLAARAQATVARSHQEAMRATFAEGLASSYEAFLDTRRNRQGEGTTDEAEVDIPPTGNGSDVRLNRYLEKLRAALPNPSAYAHHPKVRALVDRVAELWAQGEKVVVFCHYRETGRALVRHISAAIGARLWTDAERRLQLTGNELKRQVASFGHRFDVRGGMHQPLEQFLDDQLRAWPVLGSDEGSRIMDVVRRFIRTPLFVARYFDVRQRPGMEVLQAALDMPDVSGATLRNKIDGFLRFLVDRCQDVERVRYLDALDRIHPGPRGEQPSDLDGLESLQGVDLLPSVRLANGAVKPETRERLLLGFNTPFFPEVLIASSVLAEGVDLHLNCRHVIHHDLSWNPSTLEQRTGRVDRMGAKAEWVKQPIQVFLPFVAATQDEKQYRVVMDRERWFQVLMGEDYRTDEVSTDKLAERVPLPLAAARELAFDLAVVK